MFDLESREVCKSLHAWQLAKSNIDRLNQKPLVAWDYESRIT